MSKKYRISVSVDEKNFFWTVVDNSKLIKNPTKDDLKGTKLIFYNKTNICPRCREEKERDGIELTDKSILYPKNARHEIDKNGEITDEWVCSRHCLEHYNRYNPNGIHNLIKSLRGHRTGGLNPCSTQAFGDDCEELTSRWLGVKRLSVEYDKYSRLPLDHSSIPKRVPIMIGEKLVDLSGKIPQTKGRHYKNRKSWDATDIERDWYKEFDILIFYCVGEDGEIIERIYIFPIYEIVNKKCISVYKNPTNSVGDPIVTWHEKYRITDDDIIKLINDIWRNIRKERKRNKMIFQNYKTKGKENCK